MSKFYKIVLFVSTTVPPTLVGEHRVEFLSLEEARELAKCSQAVNFPAPDSFEVQTKTGVVLERWLKVGDDWRQESA